MAVFIYYAVELNQRGDAEPENVLTWTTGFPYFSPLYFDPRRRREVWRFLTYMLIHQACLHNTTNQSRTLGDLAYGLQRRGNPGFGLSGGMGPQGVARGPRVSCGCFVGLTGLLRP